MRRLLPDPGATSVGEQLGGLDLISRSHEHRPYVITNFAVTLDGRATLHGRSGPIGSDTAAMANRVRRTASPPPA